MKVVVHGEIGAGKSTAVRAAMDLLGWPRPAGFFTHWNGQARGAAELWLETWVGRRHVMARRRSSAGGGYAYALESGIERVVAGSLQPAAAGNPVMIDELGWTELASPAFVAAIVPVFRGPAPVLAVIQERALAQWLAAFGGGVQPRLLRAEPATRDDLPGAIAACFHL